MNEFGESFSGKKTFAQDRKPYDLVENDFRLPIREIPFFSEEINNHLDLIDNLITKLGKKVAILRVRDTVVKPVDNLWHRIGTAWDKNSSVYIPNPFYITANFSATVSKYLDRILIGAVLKPQQQQYQELCQRFQTLYATEMSKIAGEEGFEINENTLDQLKKENLIKVFFLQKYHWKIVKFSLQNGFHDFTTNVVSGINLFSIESLLLTAHRLIVDDSSTLEKIRQMIKATPVSDGEIVFTGDEMVPQLTLDELLATDSSSANER